MIQGVKHTKFVVVISTLNVACLLSVFLLIVIEN